MGYVYHPVYANMTDLWALFLTLTCTAIPASPFTHFDCDLDVYIRSYLAGLVNVRTHCQARVVNRISRFQKSTGLGDLEQGAAGRHSPVLSSSPGSAGTGFDSFNCFLSLHFQEVMDHVVEPSTMQICAISCCVDSPVWMECSQSKAFLSDHDGSFMEVTPKLQSPNAAYVC